MIKSNVNRFGKPLYIIYPGDYFATNQDCILGTVISACVVVCLFDTMKRIGGMGHFIVPGSIGTEGIIADEIAKHGILSMEHLLGEIVKQGGGDRHFLKAKIFGAGDLEHKNDAHMLAIIESNIKFLNEYFESEKIEVEKKDFGGSYRRKILFNPLEGAAYRKLLMNNDELSEFAKLEREYMDSVFRNKERHGKLILFE